MLTEKRAAWRMASLMCADLPQQNRTSGGSSDSDVNEFAVIAANVAVHFGGDHRHAGRELADGLAERAGVE